MSEKISKIFASQKFLFLSCAAIFLLSIFLRSTINIGSDTGFYLDLGKKIVEGKRYYYDFFESNFPPSFYFYSLQYRLATLSGISPIIMSEICINLLALVSIFFAAKILKRSELYSARRDHYNILIISFFLGFFLRIGALQIGEFGTKTSLLLILFYPYFCYSFLNKAILTKKDLIYRGILMGLIPCLKPHYIILVFFIELYHFLEEKSWHFFYRIDRLMGILVVLLYLDLMIKFTPEFLEFMVPMWLEFYVCYVDGNSFLSNVSRHLAKEMLFLPLIAPIFLLLKISKIDRLLLMTVAAAGLLIIAESVGNIDQETVFYAIATTAIFKFSYDFFSSKYFVFKENKFIILTFFLIPIFDIDNFFISMRGLALIWPAIVLLIFILTKNYKISKWHIFLYVIFLAIFFANLNQSDEYLTVSCNFLFLLIFVFIHEKYYRNADHKFSQTVIIIASIVFSSFLYLYISSIQKTIAAKSYFSSPNQLSDEMNYYVKRYAPAKEDGFLTVSNWISHQFPLQNYLQKENYFKYAVVFFYDSKVDRKTHAMFSIKPQRAFVFNYLLDDFKRQLENPHVKIIFASRGDVATKAQYSCETSLLEYYMRDQKLRQLFLQNFRFENRIVEYEDAEPVPKMIFAKRDKFSEIKPSKVKIKNDFEVYVRR